VAAVPADAVNWVAKIEKICGKKSTIREEMRRDGDVVGRKDAVAGMNEECGRRGGRGIKEWRSGQGKRLGLAK
jgi:hypothetical protein